MYKYEPPQITATIMMVEGVVLRQPSERHTYSRWITLETAQGKLVRVVIANSAPVANWIEPGQTIRVSGRMVLKQWTDGLHPTLSAHESLDAGDPVLAGISDEPDGTPKARAPRRANQNRWGAGPSGA